MHNDDRRWRHIDGSGCRNIHRLHRRRINHGRGRRFDRLAIRHHALGISRIVALLHGCRRDLTVRRPHETAEQQAGSRPDCGAVTRMSGGRADQRARGCANTSSNRCSGNTALRGGLLWGLSIGPSRRVLPASRVVLLEEGKILTRLRHRHHRRLRRAGRCASRDNQRTHQWKDGQA